jgi:KEOPS complex subunit Cgi121
MGNEIDLTYSVHRRKFFVNSVSPFLHRLRETGRSFGVRIVAFNACQLAGCDHVWAALHHARRAEEEGALISRSFELEALLYAGGTRQIQEGARFGIHQGWNRAYICIFPRSSEVASALDQFMEPVSGDWETISPERALHLRQIFQISPTEIDAAFPATLRDLILERVALLEVYR